MKTVEAIYSALETKTKHRSHLGGSLIGHDCERALFYQFRWAAQAQISGRIARLFRRGALEEPELVSDMINAGMIVRDVNPKSGEQYQVSSLGGHFGGSLDALVQGCPDIDDPLETVVAEFKTMGVKGFGQLKKNGCIQSQPRHFAQMQTYMHLSFPNNPARQIKHALYIVVCKDNDEIYSEIIDYEAEVAQALVEKARRIIFSSELPPRISEDATWYQCKFCEMSDVCHTPKLPQATCRSCIYAKAENDGNARWTCQLKDKDLSYDDQIEACDQHAYDPMFMTKWGEMTETSDKDGWIEYTMPDGRKFKNGFRSLNVFSSEELHSFTPDLVHNPVVEKLRQEFGAVIEPVKNDEFFDDEIPF